MLVSPARRVAALTAVAWLVGCTATSQRPPVMAINVGGEAHTTRDGTRFVADTLVSGGQLGAQDTVKGSQDPVIYQTYREGDVRVAMPLPAGTYDLTLKFTEPHDYAGGERVFDVYAEDQRVIDDLDVMAWRDGKVRSALSITVPDVVVADGVLNVHFEASAGVPVLSAVQIRPRPRTPRRGKLVWQDEFEREGAPDPARWTPDLWPARKVNDEDQAYTDRRKNLRVENGTLIIETHREAYGQAEYTSARLHSAGKGDILYGRIEVRARLPAGKGTWPAIWMLPTNAMRYATSCDNAADWQGNANCDAWPNSGEIDIMEHVGYQMNHVHGTVHNEAYYWAKWEQRKGRIVNVDVAGDFHVYALEWSPDQIRVYLDDHLYFVYHNEREGWRSWPYDHPFHLILNVAVGGYWGRAGGGIDERIFPQRMEVDYVRVYEMAER